MKIFICCSKAFYGKVQPIATRLESEGHLITFPNSFDDPNQELRFKSRGHAEHSKWKDEKLRLSVNKVKDVDAMLVLNLDKRGLKDYIGGATFLEMFEAYKGNKKIFLWNPIPLGILHDEIVGMKPILINGNLGLVK